MQGLRPLGDGDLTGARSLPPGLSFARRPSGAALLSPGATQREDADAGTRAGAAPSWREPGLPPEHAGTQGRKAGSCSGGWLSAGAEDGTRSSCGFDATAAQGRTVLGPHSPPRGSRSPKTGAQPWPWPPRSSWGENRRGPCFSLAPQTSAVGCENKRRGNKRHRTLSSPAGASEPWVPSAPLQRCLLLLVQRAPAELILGGAARCRRSQPGPLSLPRWQRCCTVESNWANSVQRQRNNLSPSG